MWDLIQVSPDADGGRLVWDQWDRFFWNKSTCSNILKKIVDTHQWLTFNLKKFQLLIRPTLIEIKKTKLDVNSVKVLFTQSYHYSHSKLSFFNLQMYIDFLADFLGVVDIPNKNVIKSVADRYLCSWVTKCELITEPPQIDQMRHCEILPPFQNIRCIDFHAS